MKRRTLKELNLLDDFLFGTMVTYPEIGEAFSRELLKIIFQRDFGKLVVVPQKVYHGKDTDKHGTRLDVYLEEALEEGDLASATIYDVEPNLNDKQEDVKALPKRVRYYHAMIDSKSLKSGADYKMLKNVIVIMITPFDPFGQDHMIYTVCSQIKELPEFQYEDGAKTLFLYTKGKKGNVPEALKQFLHYMEQTTEENAQNETLKKIHHMVEKVKNDEEVSIEYMKIFEREKMLIEQGKEEGLRQGRAESQEEIERLKKELQRVMKRLEELETQKE